MLLCARRFLARSPASVAVSLAVFPLALSNLMYNGADRHVLMYVLLPLYVALLIFFLLSRAPSLAGLAGSAMVGVRHETVLIFLPAVLIGLKPKAAARAIASFALVSFLWAAIHSVLLGSPFVHETTVISPSLDDPMYLQCLGPLCFRFNSLLNFQGGIVRTPGYPYPVFILLPLLMIKAFGAPLLALALLGAILAGKDRRPALSLSVGPLLFFALLLPMENWGSSKTWLLSALVLPLILLSVIGTEALLSSPKKGRAIAAAAGLALLILLAFFALARRALPAGR